MHHFLIFPIQEDVQWKKFEEMMSNTNVWQIDNMTRDTTGMFLNFIVLENIPRYPGYPGYQLFANLYFTFFDSTWV